MHHYAQLINTGKRFLLPALLLLAAGLTPVYAATCPFATTIDQLGSCTLGPGDLITFSNFQSTLPGSTVVTISYSSGSNPGSVGFTFGPQGASNKPYTISYTATCNAACLITGASNSATEIPAGASTYSYTVGGTSSGNISGNYNTSFAGVQSVTNSGSYLSGGINQSLTLDINFSPTSGTPEPTSMILFGSGFLAVGTIARFRRKRNSERSN